MKYTHSSVLNHIMIKYYFFPRSLMKMLAYARNNGIPVWDSGRTAEFVRTRDEARIQQHIIIR